MENNFFKQLSELNLEGFLNMTIKKDGDKMIVSLMVHNDKCKDEAKNKLIPLLLKGTPEELDAEFFNEISSPLSETDGLLVNMASFTKQKEEAKKQSVAEKDKKTPPEDEESTNAPAKPKGKPGPKKKTPPEPEPILEETPEPDSIDEPEFPQDEYIDENVYAPQPAPVKPNLFDQPID